MANRERETTPQVDGDLTVREFLKVLHEGVDKQAAEHGWNLDKAGERGHAFSLWVGTVIHEAEPTLDTEPEDALLRTNDLKADLVFEDTAANLLVICQCKYVKEKTPVDEAEVNDFFSRHEHYMNTDWVRKNGSEEAVAALEDYAERINNGWSAWYYFVTTGDASPRVHEAVGTKNDEYRKNDLPITCELLDLSALKEYLIRSVSAGERVPEEVTLKLPEKSFFEIPGPHPTIVAVLKGNALRNLGKQYKQSLYAWNIRGYLGNRGINKGMSETAKNTPSSFFYFNNGVSAICSDYALSGNQLTVHKFQIINGAQTVTTLEKCPANGDIQVLFRLTQTHPVKTEKGMTRDMIRFNNTQNILKVSDFRTNDPIQLSLEKAISARKPRGPIAEYAYKRRRGPKKPGAGEQITLEEMAKVRYAYLYEPTLIHSATRLLWTLEEDGGSYEKAFGVEGKILPVWADETLEEALLAYTIHSRADKEAKDLGRKDPELRYYRRLRFHSVSLAGVWLRQKMDHTALHSLARSKEAFDAFWKEFWPLCCDVETDAFQEAVEREKGTLFALVRSSERWEDMRRRFVLRAKTR